MPRHLLPSWELATGAACGSV